MDRRDRRHARDIAALERVGFVTKGGVIYREELTTSGRAMQTFDARDFATRYTAAWCSGDPARVASFFAQEGSLEINDGAPSIGRAAIAEAARGFMSAFPDMVVRMDALEGEHARFIYRWTLTGTNTGPGGTGHRVRISGYEEWTIGSDGLIRKSVGHFDQADYERQLKGGTTGSP